MSANLKQIVQFIQAHGPEYQNKGERPSGTDGFRIGLLDGSLVSLGAVDNEELGGSLISEKQAICLTVNGTQATMTWGEATELALALRYLLSVQIFG